MMMMMMMMMMLSWWLIATAGDGLYNKESLDPFIPDLVSINIRTNDTIEQMHVA